MPLSLVAGHPQQLKTAQTRNASTYASGSHPLPYPCPQADVLDLGSELQMRRGLRSASGPATQRTGSDPFQPILGNSNRDTCTGGTKAEESRDATTDGTAAEEPKLRTLTNNNTRQHTNIAQINTSSPNENHAPLPKPNRHSAIHFGETADPCFAPPTTDTTTTPDSHPHPPPTLLTTLHALRAAAHLLELHLHFSFRHLALDAFRALLHMNHHVLATLHPASKTMEVLTFGAKVQRRTAETGQKTGHGQEQEQEQEQGQEQGGGIGIEEWVEAVREVVLAGVYLIVLGAVVGVVVRVVGWGCGFVVGVWGVGRGLVGWGRWVLGL